MVAGEVLNYKGRGVLIWLGVIWIYAGKEMYYGRKADFVEYLIVDYLVYL